MPADQIKGKLVVRLFLQDTKCCPNVNRREAILDYGTLGDEIDIITAKNGQRGYKEADDISEWLSEILEEEVVLIRAVEDEGGEVDGERFPFVKEGDRKRAFLKDAAVHVVNEASVRRLKKAMQEKYNNDKKQRSLVNPELRVFRPTFVIDLDTP